MTPQSLVIMLSKTQKIRKKIGIVMLVKSYIITATKKATMQISAPRQKTNIDLSNLYTND